MRRGGRFDGGRLSAARFDAPGFRADPAAWASAITPALAALRAAMGAASTYLITGDSTRDNTYNDMLSAYYPHMLGKAGISVADNAKSGLSGADWAGGAGDLSAADAIAAIPGDGAGTVWEFSLGINDVGAAATEDPAALEALIAPGIDAVLTARPGVALFFVEPVAVAAPARNDVLNVLYASLSARYSCHLVRACQITRAVYDGTAPEGERLFYHDSTHPNKYGSIRIANFILSEILPHELIPVVTLDNTHFSSATESLVRSLDVAGVALGAYWNSGGSRSINANWACFDMIEAAPLQLVRLEHSGGRDDVRLLANPVDVDGGGDLVGTLTTPDAVNGDVYEYRIPAGLTTHIGANISSAGPYTTTGAERVEVFDLVPEKGADDLSQEEINAGLRLRLVA